MDENRDLLAALARATTPRWVPLAAILVIHDRQIARHGVAPACAPGRCSRWRVHAR